MTRTCRFPGCERPADTSDAGGPGRPSEYCTDPAHNRAAAWRARRASRAETQGRAVPDDLGRPVTMARARAGELVDQVTTQTGHLVSALTGVLEELRTLGDPDAAAAQIEAVTTDAEQRVAEALARAARAENAQRTTDAQRREADAAAEEAVDRADTLTRQLQELQDRHQTLEAEARGAAQDRGCGDPAAHRRRSPPSAVVPMQPKRPPPRRPPGPTRRRPRRPLRRSSSTLSERGRTPPPRRSADSGTS